MKSAGNYDDHRNVITNRRPIVRWYRRRYRDRILGLAPDTWLAIGFTLFVLGLGFLHAGTYVLDAQENEKDRDVVYKIGSFLMFFGWAAFAFLIDKVKRRNGQRVTFVRDRSIAFVGVSIPPPIQQEWISATFLPEIERGWVEVESERWFEPGFFENLDQPPTPATADKDGDDTLVVSSSKKKRNRKKKSNNQTCGLDETERSSEILGQVEVSNEIVTGEQPEELSQEDQQPQASGENDSNGNASDGDKMKESVEVCGQQNDSRRSPSHARDSNQTSVEDGNSFQTSDQSEGSHQTSSQSIELQQTSDQQTNTHKTSEGQKPEKLNRTSPKATISNEISICDNPEASNPIALGNTSKQSNETCDFKDSNRICSDNPEQSLQIFDHPTEAKANSDGMKPVDSKLASNLGSQQSTLKKRNRRRKK